MYSLIFFFLSYSINVMAADDWCIDPSNPPCNGAPGRCVWNPDGSQGGFVADTASLGIRAPCFRYVIGGRPTIGINAQVCESAWVFNKARVDGHAIISGRAWVYNHAQVYGNSTVYGEARISGRAKIYGDAVVTGNSLVYDVAKVFDRAHIDSNSRIHGNAQISSGVHYGHHFWRDDVFPPITPTSPDVTGSEILDARSGSLDSDPCSVCLQDDRLRDIALAPCGHRFCGPCAHRLNLQTPRKCPLCNALFTNQLRIW